MLEKIQAMLAEALNLPLEKVNPDAKIVEDLNARNSEEVLPEAVSESTSNEDVNSITIE